MHANKVREGCAYTLPANIFFYILENYFGSSTYCCYSLNVKTFFFKSLNRFFIKVDLIGWYLNINTIKTKKLVHTCKNVRWCRFLSTHTVPFGVGAYRLLVCVSIRRGAPVRSHPGPATDNIQ